MIAPAEKDIAFVAAREACVLSAYQDEHSLAFGYGINTPMLKAGDTFTLAEAGIALVAKMSDNADALDKIFAGVQLLQQHVGALLSLMWNIGTGALTRDHPLVRAVIDFRTLQGSDPLAITALRDIAAYQIIQANFDTKSGHPFNTSRRCREAVLFIEGDYGDISTLKLWPAGTNPKTDKPQLVPMPTFLTQESSK